MGALFRQAPPKHSGWLRMSSVQSSNTADTPGLDWDAPTRVERFRMAKLQMRHAKGDKGTMRQACRSLYAHQGACKRPVPGGPRVLSAHPPGIHIWFSVLTPFVRHERPCHQNRHDEQKNICPASAGNALMSPHGLLKIAHAVLPKKSASQTKKSFSWPCDITKPRLSHQSAHAHHAQKGMPLDC